MRQLILVCLILFAIQFSSYCQDNFRIKNLSVEEGLSQSSARYIFQDSLGFMWIGTADGLNRYDGNGFKIYRPQPDDSTSILSGYINCIKKGVNGDMWIGVYNGFSRYNLAEDNFRNFRLPVDKNNSKRDAQDLLLLNPHTLIIGTNQGVAILDLSRNNFYEDPGFKVVEKLSVRKLLLDKHKNLWLCTDNGLFVKNLSETTFKKYTTFDGLSSNSILTIYEDISGILVGTAEGVDQFNEIKKTFSVLQNTQGNTRGYVESILRSSDGLLWIGSQNIVLLNKDFSFNQIVRNSTNPVYDEWLSVSRTLTLCESNDGVIWAGKAQGIIKYIGTKTFKMITKSPINPITLGTKDVTGFFTPNDTILYAGGLNGLTVIDLQKRKSEFFYQATENNWRSIILKIGQDKNGNIWLGSGNGVIQFNGNEKNSFRFLEGEKGNENNISGMYVDTSQLILTVTNKGLWFFDYKTHEVKKIPFDAQTLYADRDTIMASEQNQIRIMDKQGKWLSTITGLADHIKRVTEISKDSKGRYWIATAGAGFYKWIKNENRLIQYDGNKGLNNPVVYCMREDENGNIWISTNLGLSLFDPEKETFLHFGIEDGLQNYEFNTHSAFRSKYGIMYFGGISGLNYFKPAEIMVDAPPQTSYITEIFINNKPAKLSGANGLSKNVFLSDQIELEYDENNVGFRITTLDYIHPHRVRYQYKLENFNSDWLDMMDQNYANFTNLPIGEYTFRVRASSSIGVWYPTRIAFKVRVIAPFWYTSGFRWIVLLSIVTMAFTYYRFRVRNLNQAKNKLEKIIDLRTREIQEQKEEIARQNEELTSQSDMLMVRNQSLEDLTYNLEQKVLERTEKLQILNKNLLDQNSVLEQFAFITSHNLRGPLASLKGLISLFPRYKADKDALEIMDKIDECSERLLLIISDLSNIMTIRLGIKNVLEPVSLYKELNLMIESMHQLSDTRGIKIDLSGFDQSINISGVKAYVQSIFNNLLSNAIKYAKDTGEAKVWISCTTEGDKVRITFADNGVGINMQYAREKIFQLYQRFNVSKPGKGLGLYLVKTQVEAMNGTITVTSEENVGTTFIIEFNKID